MSYIANTIEKLLTEKKMNGADLSRATGINPAQISRWLNAVQIWVSPEDILTMANALCSAKSNEAIEKAHAQLLLARLQDERTGPGASYIRMELENRHIPHSESSTSSGSKLAPNLQRDLDTLIKSALHDLEVRAAIHTFAALCKKISQSKTK